MTFDIKQPLKKLLVCGISLAMMGSLAGMSPAAAKHVSHHARTTRIRHVKKPNSSKYLSYHKMMNDMQYDYTHNSSKYFGAVKGSVTHNAGHYNIVQLFTMAKVLNNELFSYKHSPLVTSNNRVKKLSRQDSKFDTETRYYIIRDINQDRQRFGLAKLMIDNLLQSAANYRAKRVQYAFNHPKKSLKYEHLTPQQLAAQGGTTDNWVHGIDTHTSGYDYLLKHGYNPAYWGANASQNSAYTSKTHHIKRGRYESPKQYARTINDLYMNHDSTNENMNGHRKNILNPNYKYLGVGVVSSHKNRQSTDNEQFAS